MKYVNPFFLASITFGWMGLVGIEAFLNDFAFNFAVTFLTYLFSLVCFDTSFYSYSNFKSFIFYALWLIPQIIKSSIELVKLIWQDRLNCDSKIYTISCKELSPNEKVILANIITMTPGTITLDIGLHKLLVHAVVKNNNEENILKDLEFMKEKIVRRRRESR